MKYKITIEEMVSQDFLVDASDMESALKIARENYKNGKFVLEPGDIEYKQMCGECLEKNDSVDWCEF